jgi:hypothetical protein
MINHTGVLLSQFEEGNTAANNNQTTTTSSYEEDIIHSDLISDPLMDDINALNEDSSEEEDTECMEDNSKKAVQ